MNFARRQLACAGLADLLISEQGPEDALAEFSKRRVEEGHALLDLAVTANSPKAPLLRVGYLLVNGLEGLGHKFFPRSVSPPTQNLLTQTDLPFTVSPPFYLYLVQHG